MSRGLFRLVGVRSVCWVVREDNLIEINYLKKKVCILLVFLTYEQ
jgi:hypothetical protein